MNALVDIIPARYRRYLYAVIALAALTWTVYQATGGDWIQFVGGLIVALSHAVASANTAEPLTPLASPDDHAREAM